MSTALASVRGPSQRRLGGAELGGESAKEGAPIVGEVDAIQPAEWLVEDGHARRLIDSVRFVLLPIHGAMGSAAAPMPEADPADIRSAVPSNRG